MNNKIVGYGSIALAILLLFAFAVIKPGNDVQEHKSSLIPNIASQTIEWNGNPLHDSTVFDEQTNVCTASRYGMQITIWPCVAQDVDGKDIEQFVNFTWTGAQPQNTSWIFVYDGGPLESGKMDSWQSAPYHFNREVQANAWGSMTIDQIVSFQDLGTPDSRCQIGNTNNTHMYDVTRTQNATQAHTIYCFTTSQQLSASSYRLSGNYFTTEVQQVTEQRPQWVDVSSAIQYLGYGLLNDNRSYYRTQNVQFQPGQTIATRWTYTAQNRSEIGKWHILGFDTERGLTPALAQDQYIYVDPWWDNSWQYCRNITVTSGFTFSNRTDTARVYINNTANMQAGLGDVRIVNAACNAGGSEVPYNLVNTTTDAAQVSFKVSNMATSSVVYSIYYGNPAASTTQSASQPKVISNETNLYFTFGTSVVPIVNGLYNNWNVSSVTYSPEGMRIYNTCQWYTSSWNASGAGCVVTYGSGAETALIRSSPFYLGDTIQYSWDNNNVASQIGCIDLDNDNSCDLNFPNSECAGSTCATKTIDTTSYRGRLASFRLYDSGAGGGAWLAASLMAVREGSNIYASYPLLTTLGSEMQINGVGISFNYPANGTIINDNTPDISFNQTATGNTILANSTLYIWNQTGGLVYSNTQQITGTSNSTVWTVSPALADGLYLFGANVQGNSSSTVYSSQSLNRTIEIDTSSPIVNIITPSEGQQFVTFSMPYNVTLNASVIDAHLAQCWFQTTDNSTNIFYPCNTLKNMTFNLGGNKTAYAYANDSLNQIGSVPVDFFINYLVPNMTIKTPVIEAENNTINFILSASLINSLNASVNYNGTAYPMNVISQNSTFAILSTTVQAPRNLSANIQFPIWINYTINGLNYSTASQNQTVLYLTPIIVSASCNDKAMAFNVKDEQNLTSLTVDVAYNFQFGISNSSSSYKSVYGSLSNVTNFYVCINSTVSNAYVLGYGEIDYQSTDAAYVLRRYYTFTGKTLSNSTENITLYDLANSAATSFLVEAKDSTLNPYVQKFIGLLRWYPQLNTYNLVEMVQTDETGRSIMRVKSEDVDYRVALWEPNGTLIKLNDPTRFACLTQPCTYSFTVFPSDQDYTAITGIQQSLTFNETTSKFLYVWNDPSGKTQTMNLTVYRETGVNVGQICNAVGSGAIGAISCDVSGYNGQLRAVVFRTASPALPINQLVWNLGQSISSVASSMGLLISGILAIAGFFIGIFNPIIGIIMQIASLIPALYLGAITQSVIIGFAIMGVVIIHFMRRIFS